MAATRSMTGELEMTVAELIQELTNYDQGMEVVTGDLGKPELVEVLDRVVFREHKRILVRPREEELAAV